MSESAQGSTSKDAAKAAEAAAAEALRSEPDDNFKQYVLYIKAGDANSDKAVALLKKSPRLTSSVIQDVAAVPLPRPQWLVSVPTLVDRREQVVKRGSAALEQLKDWAALAPPVTAKHAQSQRGGYKRGASAYASDE
jgi:hypothetical protein